MRVKGDTMEKDTVLKELEKLSGGSGDIVCAGENMWRSRKPEYASFTEALRESIRGHDVRGSILIAADSDIIWASGTRSMDIDGETVTPLTTYEIGSITKMFTALVVMKLIGEGKLAPGDRVTEFFPGFEKAGKMTVYDLMHMRSGLVDFAGDCDVFFHNDKALVDAFDEGEITDEVFLEHLKALDLTFEPGSRMEYCNTNYVLLAMIIEKLTGKSYRENVRERIFIPAGMGASSADTWGDVTSVPEKCGYMKELHTARGAGDIHTNALDLLRFDRAFFGEKIASREEKAAMLDFIDGYGCGWEISSRYADTILHDGDTNAYSALNAVFHPEGKRCYLIMQSCCSGDDEEEESVAPAGGEAFNQYRLIFGLCAQYLL